MTSANSKDAQLRIFISARARSMSHGLKAIGWCSLGILVALYVVGAVSHGSLRHEVQTLDLWIPIVAGFNQREFARWCALPCFLFWFVIMMFIWLFLLGIADVFTGHFSPIEIVMTIIVGFASAMGAALCLLHARWTWTGISLIVLFAVLQAILMRVSFLPAIARQ